MRRARALMLCVLLLAPLAATAAPRQENVDVLFQEARRLFDTVDYEKAIPALDQVITALKAVTPLDAARRDRLASAYEMRARSRFGLGDQDGTRADFVDLLKLVPGYVLSGQVSPRVVTVFEETVRDTVTNLAIALTPATAKLELDGVSLPGPGTIRVAVGEHVLSAQQPGYRPATQTVTAALGSTAEVTLTLERIASVIRIVTTPHDVEVKMDGTVVGRTAASADAAAAAGSAASAPLLLNDVATGSHTIELTKPCHVSVTQKVDVEKPDDYTVGPVVLRQAIGGLTITASQPNAQVFVDGRERGVAPLKISDVCEGDHVVELRSAFGSDSRKVAVRTGTEVAIEGVLKPVFAIVSASGGATPPAQDVRLMVERAFGGARTLMLVAPPADQATKALQGSQLAPDWLATDTAGRPMGASAQIAGPLRKDASAKLADTFRSQGVASVTALSDSRVVIALLSAGSATPDAVEVSLDDPASISAAVARLDRRIDLTRATIGLQVVDVADMQGLVVVGIDPKGPAAASNARVGDVVLQVGGKPVSDAAAFAATLESQRPGDSIALDLKDAAGAPKRLELKVAASPRAIGLYEYGVLTNRVLLDLRARLADATDPFEQSVLRLNTAITLARLGDWAAAKAELERVQLAGRAGVGEGTVQYLLGLAAENLGNRAEAEAAFKAAAASESLLTEDGPPVKELAEARLAELAKR